MPRQPIAIKTLLTNTIACLTLALTLLNELNDAFGPQFVQPISNTVLSLITIVQVMSSEQRQSCSLMSIVGGEAEQE